MSWRMAEVCRRCADACGPDLIVRGAVWTRRPCELCGGRARAVWTVELGTSDPLVDEDDFGGAA